MSRAFIDLMKALQELVDKMSTEDKIESIEARIKDLIILREFEDAQKKLYKLIDILLKKMNKHI